MERLKDTKREMELNTDVTNVRTPKRERSTYGW